MTLYTDFHFNRISQAVPNPLGIHTDTRVEETKQKLKRESKNRIYILIKAEFLLIFFLVCFSPEDSSVDFVSWTYCCKVFTGKRSKAV